MFPRGCTCAGMTMLISCFVVSPRLMAVLPERGSCGSNRLEQDVNQPAMLLIARLAFRISLNNRSCRGTQEEVSAHSRQDGTEPSFRVARWPVIGKPVEEKRSGTPLPGVFGIFPLSGRQGSNRGASRPASRRRTRTELPKKEWELTGVGFCAVRTCDPGHGNHW